MNNISLGGTKIGMTRVFKDNASIPVTLIQIPDNFVTQIKTINKDGYSAYQVSIGNKKARNVTKSLLGHYKKANVDPGNRLREIRVSDLNTETKVGDAFSVESFQVGSYVDVSGTSIGKGFAGVVKRHGFRTQDASHGNSLSHRVHGSTGQCQTPGRVFKNKKMAGHLGSASRTIQNLKIIDINVEDKYILVQGSVPGANGSAVVVKPAAKKPHKIVESEVK